MGEEHEKHEKLELRAPLTVTWPLLEVPKATRVRASDPPNWAFDMDLKIYIFLNEKIVVKKLSSFQSVLSSKVRCWTTATVAFRGLVNFQGLSATLLDLGSPRKYSAPQSTSVRSTESNMSTISMPLNASQSTELHSFEKMHSR